MNPPIPSYPLRPINGGPLHEERPKRGLWAYEPKVNGWRAILHTPTRRMWNRHGKRLSIEHEFSTVLEQIRKANLPPELEWLNCEAFERRHALGKGSLVLLDYIPTDNATYVERQRRIHRQFYGVMAQLMSHHAPPPENSLLLLDKYSLNQEETEAGFHIHPPLDARDMWHALPHINKKWNAEVFEGLVAKRLDSPYPRQLRSPNQESPCWVKHRWEF